MTKTKNNNNLVYLEKDGLMRWQSSSQSILHWRDFTFFMISFLLMPGCRKEIVFVDDFDETLYYLNAVIGVGESPEFTLGEVTSAADTFHIDFSCVADIRLISTEPQVLQPVKASDGRCKYLNPEMTINPQTVYTVQAIIDGQTLISEIETPPLYPYNLSLADVKYRGKSSVGKIVNGEIIRYATNSYKISFEALYSGNEKPGSFVGVSLELGSDSAAIVDSDVIGRETMRPRTFDKIDELVTDTKENTKLEFVLEIQVPENMDSITLVPMVWTLDNHFYQYLQSYSTHDKSVSDPFTVPARMYSNIDGGVGIFGSYSRSADTIRVKLPE